MKKTFPYLKQNTSSLSPFDQRKKLGNKDKLRHVEKLGSKGKLGHVWLGILQ